jgi:hypothetical protein
MLEHAAIIALLVLSIWYTYQEGEVFEKLGVWFYNNLPKKIHPAVFECNICMTPHYGTFLYWLFPWEMLGFGEPRLVEWPVIIIVAMGINIVINKWSPDKEENIELPEDDSVQQIKWGDDILEDKT